MRHAVITLAALLLASSLHAGRHGKNISMNISFDDDGGAVGCDALDVKIAGERVAVVSEEVPFHGSALRVSAEEGHGGIRLFGSRGNSYRVTLCKAVAPGVNPASIRAVLAGNEVRAEGPDDEKWVGYFVVEAPRGANVELRATNGPVSIAGFNGTAQAEAVNGPVSVRDSSGTIEAITTNGPVSIKGGSGDVKLRATNGPVTVKLDGTTWNGTLEAMTQNGPATLRVPGGFRSGVVVEALGHGPVSCRGDACNGQRVALWDEDHHGKPRRIEIGSGPTVVRVSTVNGPLSVRSE